MSPIEQYINGGAKFDGATLNDHDQRRLEPQAIKVFNLLKDGKWRTLSAIGAEINAPVTSVSARLRDLRKPKFGGHQIERRRVNGEEKGLHEYRLVVK